MGNIDKAVEDLLTARADILARTNEMNGRYKKADFGLDFWGEESLPEPLDRIIQRANLADELIAAEESKGRDVDDPIVLKEIAAKVNRKMSGSIGVYWRKLTKLFHKMNKPIKIGDKDES